jgi:hypothetical protein
MSNDIEEVREGKYSVSEYILDDGTEAKAVECLPESLAHSKERLKISGLDDLKVYL